MRGPALSALPLPPGRAPAALRPRPRRQRRAGAPLRTPRTERGAARGAGAGAGLPAAEEGAIAGPRRCRRGCAEEDGGGPARCGAVAGELWVSGAMSEPPRSIPGKSDRASGLGVVTVARWSSSGGFPSDPLL